jgi:DNA-binding transcriptional regulator YbjK
VACALLRPRGTDAWRAVVEAIESGYRLTVDDLTNDLSVRDWAKEARPLLTAAVQAWMDESLAPLDERFERVTRRAGRRLPGATSAWWGERVPRNLVGELAEDVERMEL